MMNKIVQKDVPITVGDGDEDDEICERQALIDYDDDDDDEVDLLPTKSFGMRHRQQRVKNKTSLTDDDHNVGHELKKFKAANRNGDLISEPNIEYTYYDIQSSDSLQSICLRYACSVNQVKRLNGLMTDQEFYGLRRLKLPLGKLGLLEDVLKQQRSDNNNGTHDNQMNTKIVNSPGSALSISARRSPRFKPLLSPGYSSDRINDLARSGEYSIKESLPIGTIRVYHNSHSFSSLREFENDDININIGSQSQNNETTTRHNFIDPNTLKQQNFIRSELDQNGQVDVDDLLTNSDIVVPSVFEDLDYHVERAKAAAECYDQRAAELVDRIDINDTSVQANTFRPAVSKIPELFFSQENFELNFKKLIVLIFVICILIPIVYINQVHVPSHIS